MDIEDKSDFSLSECLGFLTGVIVRNSRPLPAILFTEACPSNTEDVVVASQQIGDQILPSAGVVLEHVKLVGTL